MQVTYDDTTFTMSGHAWSNTYPIKDLPRWIAFYRHQRDQFPKSGSSYDATIAALETLSAEISGD